MSRQPHYLCLSVSPVNAAQLNSDTDIDVLTIRKALQDALAELFGITAAGTYIDILAVTKSPTVSSASADAAGERRARWGEVVLRVHPSDAAKIMAAIVTASPSPSVPARASELRFSLVHESSFLPSLAFMRDI
ncbi:hypothetical protein SCLCIDRAFT_453848 [Scleroderma citrinum Foug A]|uniref:Ribonucleases P/MRP subunit Pop8-like domain-containing protein n=1 Tax=Scleroderma citrinum Foug A TaxID=1036808 RepID=A0A0C3DA50_9AGAM|nr:hypothetical protein SCLCIDRAFT_453848 [Scleroderma citrinum Foug A]